MSAIEHRPLLSVIVAVLVYIAFCAYFTPAIAPSSFVPPALVLVFCVLLFLNAKRVATAVGRHPKTILLGILLVTVCLAPGLSKLSFNVELRNFLPPTYESTKTTLEVENMLGGISSEIILIESENVLDPRCVEAVHDMKVDLENQLQGYLLAPMYDYLYPIESRLGENFPRSEELAIKLRELLSEPAVYHEVMSHVKENENKTIARLVYRVAKLSTFEEIEYARKLEKIVKQHANQSRVFKAYVGGNHSASRDLLVTITEERVYLFSIAGVLVLICLLLTFRKFRDIILSLLTIGLAILWVLCLMGWFGIEFSPVVVGVFPLLLGLGIDYSVYMNYRYSEERLKAEKDRAAAIAIATVGTAVFLSCVTTMFAYGSWLTSSMRPLFDFGSLSMMGIGFAYALTITFLPSCRVLLDRGVKKEELVDRFSVRAVERGLAGVADIVERKSKLVLTIALVVTLLAAFSASKARTAIDWDKMLPEHVESLETSNRYLQLWPEQNPLNTCMVLVKGDLTSPDVLNSMYHLETYLPQKSRYIQGSMSVASMIAGKYGGRIPEDSETIARMLNELPPQYRALLSYDSENRIKGGVIVFFTSYRGDNEMKKMVDSVREEVRRVQKEAERKGIKVEYSTGGLPAIYSDLLSELVPSQLRTTLISFIGCFLIVWAVFRRVSDAALCMLPVGLTLVWGLGMFSPLDIPINLLTVLVSALMIGIGIDYSIHVRHRFEEEISKGRTVQEATRETMVRIGGAILGAASTSLAAMGTLTFSRMPAIGVFGEIVALEFFSCLCAVFFVLPCLLAWRARRRLTKNSSR
jgi:hydrophobe/amphiphile efflux-3 (HAE3) family protein